MSRAVVRVDAAMGRLRRRLVVLAVAVVAVVLAVTGFVLVLQHRSRLVDGVDDSLRTRAAELVAEFSTGRDGEIGVTDLEDQAAQVTTLDGTVVASSVNLTGEAPIGPIPEDGEIVRTTATLPVEDDDYRVLSVRGDSADVVVHVAENIDDIADSTRTLAISLAMAFPLVVAALGVLTWALVGRTLRPVRSAALRQEQFVADASHELRSPLARVRNRLEVDLAHPEGVDPVETTRAVLAETRALEALVADLLDLANGQQAQPDELVDLDEIVLSEVEALRTGASVAIDVSDVSGAAVRGRRSHLTRVVRNLLDNALRHARTVVRVVLREAGDTVLLQITDDGPGIPPDKRSVVFERFATLDGARTPGHGAGLGLAIAREIVEAHGGSIVVAESSEGGASVRVDLPVASVG